VLKIGESESISYLAFVGGEDEVGEIKLISFICICCNIEIVEEMEGRSGAAILWWRLNVGEMRTCEEGATCAHGATVECSAFVSTQLRAHGGGGYQGGEQRARMQPGGNTDDVDAPQGRKIV
jgi:hypothetical protein